MLPVWSKDISVHNDRIDEQHKKLFEIAGRDYALTNKQTSKEEIIEILRELLQYTQEHFKDEEQYMASIYYPYLEQHKAKHREIIRDMTVSVTNIRNVNDLKTQLGVIAKKWLLEHILKEDMQIEKFRRNTCQLPAREIEDDFVEEKEKYGCECPNKVHLVPLDVHKRIQEGAVFSCKVCSKQIRKI